MLGNRDLKIDSLASIEVLASLTSRELRQVSALTTEVRLKADHELCQEGDAGREVFLLLEGTVAVTREGTAIGVARSGSLLGEMAVLARRPRAATLTALTEVTILAMTAAEFSALVTRFPAVRAAIRELVESRRGENELLVA